MAYLAAFFASFFFAILYNVRGRLLFISSFCGMIGKIVFDLLGEQGLIIQFLVPTIVMCVYAEIFARICKAPVMVIIIVGILPIVPGAGVYNTIDSLLNSHMSSFYMYGINTLLSTGAMALGLVLVSSLARLIKMIKRQVPYGRRAHNHFPRMR